MAALHIETIDTGFISSLGHPFVTALYEMIATDERAFGFVAERERHIVGFIAFAEDLPALYKSLVRKGGIRFAGLLMGRLFSLRRCKRILETLLYPTRSHSCDMPKTELLTLAVAANARQQGIGCGLLAKGLEACAARGLDQVKVCVGGQRAQAQRLYENFGFQLACDMSHHGEKSKFYVWTQDKE